MEVMILPAHKSEFPRTERKQTPNILHVSEIIQTGDVLSLWESDFKERIAKNILNVYFNCISICAEPVTQVVEALFLDDEILNRFWCSHDAATDRARQLLRFGFEQVCRMHGICGWHVVNTKL
jgi:hypothetical protein